MGLLAKEVETLQHRLRASVRVQLDIVAHGIGREKAVYAARRDQFFSMMVIEESIRFGENLPRLRALFRMRRRCADKCPSVPRYERTATSR